MDYEKKLIEMIKKQGWLIEIFETARDLNLPNWYIGAGIIRNTVWDLLSFGKLVHPITDIDLVFYDKKNTSREYEDELRLKAKMYINDHVWEIKNHARGFADEQPTNSIEERISKWPETATTVCMRYLDDGTFKIFSADNGLEDLFNMVVRPTKNSDKEAFQKRYMEKHWLEQWPNLKVVQNLASTLPSY